MKNKIGTDTILILIAIIVTAVLLIIALANKGETVEDTGEDAGGLSQVIQQANNQELFKFNGLLQGWEGQKSGKDVKKLYTAIANSNRDNPDKQIIITGIETEDKIDESKTYIVSFSKDQKGYYNEVKVEEKK